MIWKKKCAFFLAFESLKLKVCTKRFRNLICAATKSLSIEYWGRVEKSFNDKMVASRDNWDVPLTMVGGLRVLPSMRCVIRRAMARSAKELRSSCYEAYKRRPRRPYPRTVLFFFFSFSFSLFFPDIYYFVILSISFLKE